jgi:D-aminopeptidase
MTPEMRRAAEQMIDELGYADVFVRDSYNNFKKVLMSL